MKMANNNSKKKLSPQEIKDKFNSSSLVGQVDVVVNDIEASKSDKAWMIFNMLLTAIMRAI